jgi:hypothetical protein
MRITDSLTESLTHPQASHWNTHPMTTRTQQTTSRRWVIVFLAALVAVLATILSSVTASAATTVVAETRVGAHNVVLDEFVGPPEHIRAGQRLGNDAAAPGIVVATGVAAKTAAKACSFAGATTVLMADGTRRPIEDVKVGDEVIATDPETGEQVAKTVEHVFVHDDIVVDLVVDGEVITTTADHPFWSVTDQRFERADELSRGEKVLGADGTVITVSGLELGTAREALAYNLSVKGIHTYHVGTDAILVHNSCFTSLDALNNPKSLEGLTPSQVDDLARNAGFEVRAGSASAKNPATRYYLPGTNGSQGFRVLPQGVPGQPGVKSGTYLKYFGGPLHGTRVPLGMP